MDEFPRPNFLQSVAFFVSKNAQGQLAAIVAVLAAFAIKSLVDSQVRQQDSPFLIFPAAIMLSAWYGGWKAGCTAVVLSTMIINWVYLPPQFSFFVAGSDTQIRLSLFLVEGAMICLLAESLHRSQRLAENRALEAKYARSTASKHEMDLYIIQEQLSSRDAMFRHLVDANVLGVIVCRLDGKIVDANKAFLQMVEATPEDLAAGKVDWRKLTPPEFHDLDARLIRQLETTGRFEAAEKEYVLASGRRLPVWIAGAFAPSRDHVMCFVMDRSLQKQAEVALVRAKEAAERSNRTRGEFLANVSHELRTPMNAILGMTELVLDEELPAHIRDYLETSVEASRTLLYLLDDLLDLSRIESGKMELDSLPFSLRNTIDQAMRILSLRAAEKGLELVCSVGSEIPDRLTGDQGRLRQIVLNLVNNAIKFTSRGEVIVELSMPARTETTGRDSTTETVDLCLAVRDTGIGISADDQARIFEPFTQVDASSTRNYGGTGLGLAIVRQLAQLMDGDVAVESQPGAGATFVVNVRLSVSKDEAESASIERDAYRGLRGIRVLVVDDNHTNRNILHGILSSWSMPCVVAADAKAALAAMRASLHEKREFQVILVDALMPAMDGLQFIQAASSEGLLHGAPILMVSSTDRRALEPQLRSLPIAGLLGKPISQSELLDTLMESLQGSNLQTNDVNRISAVRQGLQILVAEDAPANRKVVKAILEKRGHHVTLAMNGHEAVDLVRHEHFDVVLMDVQMPLLDGWDATRAIRALPIQSRVPIIAMTAHAMRGDRERCLAAGMNDYVSKPLDAHQLIRLVERMADQYRTETVVPAPQQDVRPTPLDNVAAGETRPALIDRRATLQRLGGDTQLMREMAAFFLEDAPLLLLTIQQHRAGEEATRAAHSLRGLASNFGAASIVEPAMKVESSESAAEVRESSIAALEKALPQVLQELQLLVHEEESLPRMQTQHRAERSAHS